MTAAEVSAWLGEDLPPRTDRSKGLGALLTELEDIRRSGFAYDDEEHTEGVSAISVSIGTYRGAYAITIIAPTARLHSKRSEEHTSELQSLMRISYAVFCLQKNTYPQIT